MNGRSNTRLGEGWLATVLDLAIPTDGWVEEQLYCSFASSVSSASLAGLTLFGLVTAESGKAPGIRCTLGGAFLFLLGVGGFAHERAAWVRTIMGVVDLEPGPRDVCIESAFIVSRKCDAVTSVDSDASQACKESRVGD